mmetsp:Transcript_3843/g.5459  ORF Transcript_3843/g.5459 Transcript_3843/m.5459 type:complete len:141 (+) Transcript_3843:258-680(+)
MQIIASKQLIAQKQLSTPVQNAILLLLQHRKHRAKKFRASQGEDSTEAHLSWFTNIYNPSAGKLRWSKTSSQNCSWGLSGSISRAETAIIAATVSKCPSSGRMLYLLLYEFFPKFISGLPKGLLLRSTCIKPLSRLPSEI